jgi:hypothetical protein
MIQSNHRPSGANQERHPATGRPVRLLAGLAVFAIVTTLAACSASSSQPGVATLESAKAGQPSASASGADFQQSLLEFAACMRDHGIDMPDPEFGADGMPDFRKLVASMDIGNPDFTAARQACSSYMAGLATSTDPKVQAEWQQALVEFAGCMRDHGIDMPDPQPGIGPFRNLAGVDTSSPEFEAAYEACADKLSGIGQ